MREKIFYTLISGIFFGAIFFEFIDTKSWIFFLFSGVFFFLLRNKKLISLFLIIISLVLLRGHVLFSEPQIPKYVGETISVTGIITSEPDIRETTMRLILSLEKIEIGEKTIYTDEKTIVIVPIYPSHEIGDHIVATGKFKIPENFENDNGIEFDYVSFLEKDRIYSLVYYSRINKIGENEKLIHPTRWIFKMKQKFLENIQKVIPSPEAELMGGILLGTKRSLGKDLEDKFRITGLVHIVVLSGYNITIIADAIFRFLGFLPKIFATTLGIFSVIIFAIMVGSGATVIRATVMTLLAIVARVSGRTYNVNRALFLAASLMIWHNPMILFHDPSFQLSFIATLGLINLSPFVEKKILFFIPQKFELREISTATLATQASVLPLLMKMTGELSVVAPIVNILTLQVIPITMLMGFLTGLGVFISEKIGLVLGFLPYLSLKYVLLIVNFFSSFEFATITL